MMFSTPMRSMTTTSSLSSSGPSGVALIFSDFVKNKTLVWIVYGQAKAWQVTPSSLLGVKTGSYEAWCLDQAVNYFGNHVEVELEKVGQKLSAKERALQANRQRKLEKLLDPNPEVVKKGQFMDPALFFK